MQFKTQRLNSSMSLMTNVCPWLPLAAFQEQGALPSVIQTVFKPRNRQG